MNLVKLLGLERPLIILDTETTGPNPREDRIVEIGFIQLQPGKPPRLWESFVNPGIPIPAEATHGNPERGYEGHGISDDQVANAPTFATLAPHLLRGFHDCDYGGYNIRSFDLPIVQAEFQRNGHTWSYADAKLVDGFRLWQLGRKRSLSDAVEEFLGHKHEGAHRALDDVRASADVIEAQLTKFVTLPRTLGALHDLQFPSDPNAIDPDGKLIWRHGLAMVNFGKHKGLAFNMVPRNYLDWVANRADSMPEAFRRICADALAGKFPTKE